MAKGKMSNFTKKAAKAGAKDAKGGKKVGKAAVDNPTKYGSGSAKKMCD